MNQRTEYIQRDDDMAIDFDNIRHWIRIIPRGQPNILAEMRQDVGRWP